MTWSKKEAKYGDHIRVMTDTGYYHHAIYINDKEVIHFSTDNGFSILSRDLEIKSTSINIFTFGETIEVKKYDKKEILAEKSVQIAKNMIGNKDYDLVFNNCEHFASFCITGKRKSEIIDKLKEDRLKIRKENGVHGMIDRLYVMMK
jgi:hypothetical protein